MASGAYGEVGGGAAAAAVGRGVVRDIGAAEARDAMRADGETRGPVDELLELMQVEALVVSLFRVESCLMDERAEYKEQLLQFARLLFSSRSPSFQHLVTSHHLRPIPAAQPSSVNTISLASAIMPRTGRSSRADAITNSPFVRALIRPVSSIIVPQPLKELPPPRPEHLIATQPLPLSVKVVVEDGKGKRKREEEDEGAEQEMEKVVEKVVTRYTEENLPPELKKCTQFVQGGQGRRGS